MNRKSYFGKSLKFLIVCVLIITAFVRGTAQGWSYIGVFGAWGISLIVVYGKSSFNVLIAKLRQKKKQTVLPPNEFEISDISDSACNLLLMHINHRISAYLKAVYPSVSWKWETENPERIAIEGGVGRIRLFDISDFNYAEIVLDQTAKLDCALVKIVPIAELKNGTVSSESTASGNEQANLDAWYNIQGKQVLESCIADLHSRGLASLYIRENGEICVKQGDKSKVQAKFSTFPSKGIWQGLVKVLENNSLSASLIDNVIKVGW